MRKNCKITKPEMIANSDNIAKIGKIDNTWHIGKTCSKDARQVRFTWLKKLCELDTYGQRDQMLR